MMNLLSVSYHNKYSVMLQPFNYTQLFYFEKINLHKTKEL
jgi:hypothetical protein